VATFPDDTLGTGTGWPDPTEPGVPAASLQDGYHWLGSRDGGCPVIAQWSPDSWSWIFAQITDRLMPEEIDGMNYLGPVPPPAGPQPTA
jgi:hypothetical protein